MKKQAKLERAFLSKPGDTIIDTIDFLKMSQAELAERMGRTASKINDLISGKEPITTNTALQLEKVLGINVEFWLKREATYRERLARIEDQEKMACWIPWAQLHPIRELKKYGFIKPGRDEVGTVKDLLLFYGVVSPQQWEIVYVPQYTNTRFRKSEAFESAIAGITSWLRMGELAMKNITLPIFDKESFKDILTKVRDLAVRQPEDFAIRLQEECLKAGVAIIYTPGIPNAPISGAARWIAGNPLIQLTDRYKVNDHFWFTFYHEAAHILLHGKKEVFLEDVSDHSQDAEKEDEANKFAARYLLPEKFIENLPDTVTDQDILRVAEKYNIHPGIVVGRLQRMKVIDYAVGNKFKQKLSLFD